jgi:2-methylcitrate dehydratase PrpD
VSETVADVVGQWVAGLTYDAIPDRVRLETKKALINSVGTGIGGFALPDAQYAINVAKADDTGNSTLLVDGGRVPMSSALLANTVLFNVLGQEETHPGAACHPSEVAVPLGVTVAERLSINGKELLAAMVAGMEVEIQLNSLDFLPKPRHMYCETSAV